MDNNEVSDEILERYKHMVAATVYSALSRMGYENCIIEGVKPFTPVKSWFREPGRCGIFRLGRTWWPKYEGDSREW